MVTFASNGAEHRTSLHYTVFSRFISLWEPLGDFNTILEARLQRFIEVWRNKVEGDGFALSSFWFVNLHIDFAKFNLSTTRTTE